MPALSDYYPRTVKISIRVVNGELRQLDGTELPKLREDAVGEVVLSSYAIVDDSVRRQLQLEETKAILPKGATVLLGVDLNIPPEFRNKTIRPNNVYPPIPCRFVQVHLKEDLRLRLRGSKTAVLQSCACMIPAINEEATSLNHAYTLISQEFEISRKSHSGNVFKRGYYWKGDCWAPLDELRFAAQAEFDRCLAERKEREGEASVGDAE